MSEALLRRVVVLGGAGAGKSTLARALGERICCPVTHLDRIVYGAGWAPAPPKQVRAEVERLVRAPCWVIEGTFPELFDLLLPAADLVVWIEQPWPMRLWRSWRKTRLNRDRNRPDRPEGAEEVFGLAYVRTILGFGRFTPDVAAALHSAAPNTPVRRLRGDKALRAFVEGAARRRPRRDQ